MTEKYKEVYSIIKNKYGFFELKDKPSEEELKGYYTEKYYQEDKGNYQQKYNEEELEYIFNKLEQKFSIIQKEISSEAIGSVLDIGCGEGWALKFFKEKGWKVQGLDFSEEGCRNHNPDYVKYISFGDISDNIENLIVNKKKFDIIWIDNVLEHVLSPLSLLEKCYELANKGGILVIEVPNDFSIVQKQLLKSRHINKEFWVAIPDHLSYFNKEGLVAVCEAAEWTLLEVIGDFPIDFNLFNPRSNYIQNGEVGRSCHLARVEIENLLHSISVEKTNMLYKAFADLGLGRQLIGFFRKEM